MEFGLLGTWNLEPLLCIPAVRPREKGTVPPLSCALAPTGVHNDRAGFRPRSTGAVPLFASGRPDIGAFVAVGYSRQFRFEHFSTSPLHSSEIPLFPPFAKGEVGIPLFKGGGGVDMRLEHLSLWKRENKRGICRGGAFPACALSIYCLPSSLFLTS